MKTIRKKILSGLMAIALVVSLLAVAPVSTYAATKYVKSYTETYTLKTSSMYEIPLKMKEDASLTIEISVIDGTAGEQMFVVPQLWEDYESGSNSKGLKKGELLGLGSDAKGNKRASEATFKGDAVKGNKSAITLGIGHTTDSKIKIKIKITSKKKVFCVQDIENITD